MKHKDGLFSCSDFRRATKLADQGNSKRTLNLLQCCSIVLMLEMVVNAVRAFPHIH